MKKLSFCTIAILFMQLMLPVQSNAQPFKKLGNAIKKGTDKINKKVNKFLYGEGSGKLNSEIKDKDFFQLKEIPAPDTSNTRFKIAQNLFIDIKDKYPRGYQPKWRFISYNSSLTFSVENWVAPSSGLHHNERNISIGDYNGKAVMRLGGLISCDCFADIIIRDSLALISDTPQTFKVTNFRKILNERSTGEPCVGGFNNTYTDGGWEGKITLSANEDGNITMDLMLENYSVGYQPSFQKEYMPSQVSYRYIANGITMENEMSAKNANRIIAEEIEAKQRQKNYMAKMEKQGDSIQKIIKKKYPQASCKECFYSSGGSYISTTTVNEYYVSTGRYAGSRTDWDLNIKTEISNKCNYNLLLIGIQQFHDEDRGYYLKDVTKVMPANYNYSTDQGIISSLFTSLIGAGSEFDIKFQDKYYPGYASVGSVQWLKVIRKK